MADDPRWSLDESAESNHQRPRLTARKRRLFRLIASGVPITIGLSLFAIFLAYREMLVIDQETGWLRFQRPPIYLEEPGHKVSGHRYIYDASLGWRNIPNWQATTWDRKLTTNSKGLRDREYAFKKPAGVRRILVLGDSYAWGYGVADEEVFSEQLETRLVNWQILNAGVSGWGTDQEYQYFIEEGVKYSPDIVVLALFLLNDLENNINSVQYGLSKPLFVNTRLERVNVPVPKPESSAVSIRSEVDSIDLAAVIIARMAELCAARECRFVVMKFGTFLVAGRGPFREVELELAKRLALIEHVLYLDLDAEFAARGIGSRELLLGNNDGHWNAFGHRQTAIILHDFLSNQNLIYE